MENQARHEILQGFLIDIKNFITKIDANTASARDYQLLQEYFELVGVEKAVFNNLLAESKFDGWVSFYNERLKKSEDQNLYAVKFVLGQLRGIGSAIIELLNNEINKHNKKQTVSA